MPNERTVRALMPPDDAADGSLHWVTRLGVVTVGQWMAKPAPTFSTFGRSHARGSWRIMPWCNVQTDREAHADGFRYVAPAIPPEVGP